jgi:tRNA-intron endonuclease
MAERKIKVKGKKAEADSGEKLQKEPKKAIKAKEIKNPAKAKKSPKEPSKKKKIDMLLEEIEEEESDNFSKEDDLDEEDEDNAGECETFYEKPAWKNEKKVYFGELVESKVYVWGAQESEEIYDLGCFGKIREDKRNELSLEEALLLLKRNKLKVKYQEEEFDEKGFFGHACRQDAEFPWKFAVYEDLRGRGLLVRTGFKFGTHFRVYARGVKLKRGPKNVKEHTKWIVHAIPENYTCSFPELSRAVRLAHNIRAKMLWAVVDEEGDVTYYEVLRKTP